MFEVVVLYLSAFIIGLSRGSLICATICAPTLVPYLSSKGISVTEGFKRAVFFNLPRVAILTTAGGIIGFLSFGLVNQPYFSGVLGGIKTVGYLFMGMLILVFGAVLFLRATIPINSEKEMCAHCMGCGGTSIPVVEKNIKKEELLILSWGSLLGLVCLSEIALLEGSVIASLGGILGDSPLSSAFIGATVMLVFGIGASLPIIVLTITGVKYSERFSEPERLRELRKIGGIIMVMLGLTLMLREVMNVITLF